MRLVKKVKRFFWWDEEKRIPNGYILLIFMFVFIFTIAIFGGWLLSLIDNFLNGVP